MDSAETVAGAAYEISRKGSEYGFGRPNAGIKDLALWEDLRSLGTSLWLDTINLDCHL